MSAVLPSPPPGIRMRPFRIVDPIHMVEQLEPITSCSLEEVICLGPFQFDAAAALGDYRSRSHLEHLARRDVKPRWFAAGGEYVCSADQGRYVMLWRVSKGRPRKRGPGARVHWDHPPHKLAHWDTLEAGVGMILCPEPDDETIEGAVVRATYMRSKGRGRFQPFFDDAGALWVTRLPDAP